MEAYTLSGLSQRSTVEPRNNTTLSPCSLCQAEIFIKARFGILLSTSTKSILFPVSFHRFMVFDIRCSVTCLAFFSSLKYRKAVLIWHLTFLATVPVEIERICLLYTSDAA